MTSSSEQPKEYIITIKLTAPAKMRELGIERYIKSQIFKEGWGEAFCTNYLHVKQFTFSRPHPAPVLPNPTCPGCNQIDVADRVLWLQDHDAAIARKAREDVLKEAKQDRKVITLCGSVKFWDEYKEWNARLTLEGNVVFSCGLSLKEGYEDLLCDLPLDDVKKDLDQIHLCKINLSDEIFVLNVGGYIGDSTKREIEYALSKGKRVRYLESLRAQQAGDQHE